MQNLMKFLLIYFFFFFCTFFVYAEKISIIYSCNSLNESYETFIDDNGNVIIFESDYFDLEKNNPKNVITKTLSEKEIKELKSFILNADVFNLKDEYISSPVLIKERSDTLTFVIDGKIKKILCSNANLPISLSKIIDKIQDIRRGLKYVKEE